MPFDALFLTAVTKELQSAAGMRIDRVQQPTRDTVLLALRGNGGQKKLFISASPNNPRVQFTELGYENPAQPPMFCMLLRKHLIGSRIQALVQEPMERLLTIVLESPDELGVLSEKHLILELMGRGANLILTDAENRIIDCLRRVDLEASEQRQLLPGLFYRMPPKLEKANPLLLSAKEAESLLSSDSPVLLDKLLLQRIGGISPLICRELSYRLTGSTESDACTLGNLSSAGQVLADFLQLEPIPILLSENGSPKDFSCREIIQYGGFRQIQRCSSFSELLDSFYGKRERSERQRQRSQQLTQSVSVRRDRTRRKLLLQQKELADSLGREGLRQKGDLIMANLYQIRKGETVLKAQNFYDPELKELSVPLQPQLSPQQNAARYYKEYAKAKNAEKILKEQISRGSRELEYLNSVLDELSRAETDRDLTEIKAELIEQGYIRENDRKKQMKQPPSRPMRFLSSEGMEILAGRNNRQNDLLTLKTASKGDIWLHAQKVHGSHVIIVCGSDIPGDQTITEAAALAAWFSQARGGQNVPVDMTRVKNVKKPAGSMPGMVTYDKYSTVFVTPEDGLAERLSREKG